MFSVVPRQPGFLPYPTLYVHRYVGEHGGHIVTIYFIIFCSQVSCHPLATNAVDVVCDQQENRRKTHSFSPKSGQANPHPWTPPVYGRKCVHGQ
jgi:putative component of membrane protein insertase Oxa1/YidC/SpoIIIJ protein YidD